MPRREDHNGRHPVDRDYLLPLQNDVPVIIPGKCEHKNEPYEEESLPRPLYLVKHLLALSDRLEFFIVGRPQSHPEQAGGAQIVDRKLPLEGVPAPKADH